MGAKGWIAGVSNTEEEMRTKFSKEEEHRQYECGVEDKAESAEAISQSYSPKSSVWDLAGKGPSVAAGGESAVGGNEWAPDYRGPVGPCPLFSTNVVQGRD